VDDQGIDLFEYVELEYKISSTQTAEYSVPSPNPWGKSMCQEVFTLVWREEYDYLPGKWLGFISVDNDKVHYSYLKKDYRNRGLGLLMYELTLEIRGKLVTEYALASDKAKYVWAKLAMKYDHHKTSKYFKVYK
jgi:hypothetical protein